MTNVKSSNVVLEAIIVVLVIIMYFYIAFKICKKKNNGLEKLIFRYIILHNKSLFLTSYKPKVETVCRWTLL